MTEETQFIMGYHAEQPMPQHKWEEQQHSNPAATGPTSPPVPHWGPHLQSSPSPMSLLVYTSRSQSGTDTQRAHSPRTVALMKATGTLQSSLATSVSSSDVLCIKQWYRKQREQFYRFLPPWSLLKSNFSPDKTDCEVGNVFLLLKAAAPP